MTGSCQPWSCPWKQVLLGRTAISQRMRREREGTPLAGFTYSYFFCGCAWVKEPCCNLVSLWYRPILRFGDSHDFYQQKKIGQLTTKGQANNDSFVSGHSWDSKPFTGFNRTSETWLCRGTGKIPWPLLEHIRTLKVTTELTKDMEAWEPLFLMWTVLQLLSGCFRNEAETTTRLENRNILASVGEYWPPIVNNNYAVKKEYFTDETIFGDWVGIISEVRKEICKNILRCDYLS